MRAALAEVPDKPGINGAEKQFARFGLGASAGHVVEYPAHLGAGKIGIEHKAGFLTNNLSLARSAQLVAKASRAAVLPYNGIVYGCTGGLVPHNSGFALVGDANCGQFVALHIGVFQAFLGNMRLRVKDFIGVMFNPAGLGEYLGKFPLGNLYYVGIAVKKNGARAGSALVKRQNVFMSNIILRKHCWCLLPQRAEV